MTLEQGWRSPASFWWRWASRPPRAGLPPGCRGRQSRVQWPTVPEEARNGPARIPSPELARRRHTTAGVAWKRARRSTSRRSSPRRRPRRTRRRDISKPCSSSARKWKSASLRGAIAQSRKQAVEQRLGRFWPVFQSWSKDPRPFPPRAIDAVVSEFDTGFRKLDWAQQRPRCVFETGIGVTARIPHVQTADSVGASRPAESPSRARARRVRRRSSRPCSIAEIVSRPAPSRRR